MLSLRPETNSSADAYYQQITDTDISQLYMEDLREQGAEHGIYLQPLEAAEQRREAGEAAIHSDVLQSPVQELGKSKEMHERSKVSMCI